MFFTTLKIIKPAKIEKCRTEMKILMAWKKSQQKEKTDNHLQNFQGGIKDIGKEEGRT